MSTPDTDLSAWVGRSETLHDTITSTPVKAMSAMLDHPPGVVATGTVLPPLWHWLYFLPMHQQSEIGADGHARRGGFLPPVSLPRRMWAGSQFEFRSSVQVGDVAARTSIIESVSTKEGRTGKLVFVKVRHELRCNSAVDPAIVEFHDIVYRGAQRADDVVHRRWLHRREPRGNAKSFLMMCCCFATPHSPSTDTAFTMTAAM